MSIIVVIRAGRTNYDQESRLIGLLDLPLNEEGVRQVRETTQQIRDLDLEVIFASPEDPACGTARPISEQLNGVRFRELKKLRNVDQGLWQGLPESEVRKRYPRQFRSCREKPQTICAPEGESLSAAY